MKRKLIYILVTTVCFCWIACKHYLDVQPLNKVSASQLLSDPNGVKILLATLYNEIPMEDFSYNPGAGFNYHGDAGTGYVPPGWSTSLYTDESINTAGYGAGPINDHYWSY